jgi:hypothetical protein
MNIFKQQNSYLQNELDKQGYVKLDLLPLDVAEELSTYYNRMPNSKNDAFGFHVTLDLNSEEKINEISTFISSKIKPFSEQYFNNYKFISPRFAIKEPNQNSMIPPHQDWSFVEEEKYESYNLWIAITPSTDQNGTLGFIPGSHLKLKNIRATPLPIYKVPFCHFAMDLLPHINFESLNIGQAFLFNSKIIHASKPNVTNKARINIAVEITDKEAQLKHYYLNPNSNKVEEFNIDESFFNKYSNAKLTELYKQGKGIDFYEKCNILEYKPEKINIYDLI